MLQKNTAGQFIYFALINASNGSAHTGQTPTGYVSIDAAGQTGIGGSIAELANGQYKIVLSQGDTNGDELGYFIANSGSIPVSITVTTETKKMADLNDIAAGAAMNLAADAIKAVSYDESTAYPIISADTGNSQIARVGADGDTLESLSDEIAAVPDAAAVKSEVVDALTDIHLDHVLAVDFDSAAPVGNATSFLRQLVENDSGTARFTTNSLEQGPGGGDATEAKQDTIISNLGTVDGKVDTMDTNVDDIETLLGTVDGKVDTMDTNVDDIETLLGTVDGKVDAIPDAAAIEAACDATIVTYQLDHLLHTEYAGSAASGTVMDDLLESDGGIYRFNANALEEGPSGGGAATLQNQVDMLANLATTDGKIDTMDTNVDDIETLLGTVDGKIDTMDTNVDDVETLLGTVDGKIDTMDTNVDDVETLLGTVDGKIDTADTAIDLIMDILEGDHVVDDNETPYEYLIKRKGTETVLVTKEMYELDDTNITAVDQIVSKLIEPA